MLFLFQESVLQCSTTGDMECEISAGSSCVSEALNDVMNHSSMHCTILNCSLDMSLFISFEDVTLFKYEVI